MKKTIYQYRKIVGDELIAKIYESARPLFGKHIIHINSTYIGGGVAETLDSLVALFNDIGIRCGWRLLHGPLDFFTVTKKLHNALQGGKINLSDMKIRIYFDCNEKNSVFTHIEHDCVIVHDPQPLPMITFYEKNQPWIWRCHVDLSNPDREVWNFLKTIVLKYDAMVVSSNAFRQPLQIPQYVMYPSIDPLNTKNKDISESTISNALQKYGVDTEKPIITQVSRFDRWKDPLGVIKAYKRVKQKVDCVLVLAGSMATDDPEGQKIYEYLVKKTTDKDIHIISGGNDVFINALQRKSAVMIQKSIKEGFGLTVSEALWKGTPVVASNVGGIPLQVVNNKTGYLVKPNDIDGCADRIVYLLRNPKIREKMGKRGREHIKNNFLITRQLLDWVNLINHVINRYTARPT